MVEITIALGVLALALVTLVGLWLQALEQVGDVQRLHASGRVISTFRQSLVDRDWDGNPNTKPFEDIYKRVASGPAVFYIFSEVGGGVVVTDRIEEVRKVDKWLFALRVSASGINPAANLTPVDDTYALLPVSAGDYPEAYLALRVDVHSLGVPNPGSPLKDMPELNDRNYATQYHTALTR